MSERYSVPASLSLATQASYTRLSARLARRPARARCSTPDEFRAAAAARDAEALALVEHNPDVTGCEVVATALGGTPVLDVRARVGGGGGGTLLYVHGGAFVLLSARSTLPIAARLARSTGARVLSIDYTLAPHARWRAITAQVIAVHAALIEQGVAARHIGVVGDSAGGAIATSAILQIAATGLPAPAALALASSVTDLTLSGDTVATLGERDLILDPIMLREGYDAYADPNEHRLGQVSPAWACYSEAFPPTLLQVGTRELLLSDTIMLHRAMLRDKARVVLDVYEGMPHSFPAALPDTSESREALAHQAAFLRQALAS